jgi:hypothetical protein
LFFFCCDSVAADFEDAATRQPVVPQAQANCVNLRRQHRKATVAGIGLGTTAMYMQRTIKYITIKYMRGAAGIGMSITIKYLRRTTSAAAKSSLSTTIKYLVT